MIDSCLHWSQRICRLAIAATLAAVLLAVCSSSDAQDLPPTLKRLLEKAQTAVAEVQRRVEGGEVPQDVLDELQKLDGLMQTGRHEDAEALLDRALAALEIDPKTLEKTKKAPTPAKPEPSSPRRPLPKFNPAGFTKIFDGESLDSWDGDPTYWKVDAGALAGEVTP